MAGGKGWRPQRSPTGVARAVKKKGGSTSSTTTTSSASSSSSSWVLGTLKEWLGFGAAPTTPKTSSSALGGGASASPRMLADTPVRYDASAIDYRKKGEGGGTREHTPVAYEGQRSPHVMEGDGRISTPEQLDSYLKQLRTSLDSGLRSAATQGSSPYAHYASPSDGPFGLSLGSSATPTLPQYKASPPPVSVVKSPGEKSLASSWEAVGDFLERSGMSVNLLELTEDNLRQWFASTVLHTLVDRIHNAHRVVERAAAAPGAACPANVPPPPVKVLPLTMCPSVGLEEATGGRGKDQYLDKYQLEKWLEVLSSAPAPQPTPPTTMSLFSSPATQQPQYDQAKRKDLVQAIRDWLGLLLLLEGKCPGAKELLPPFPKAYLNSRIHEIAAGSCVNGFRWNSGKSHLPAKKWNKNDFPTDSSILCYLFCVFLRHPGWRFEGDFKLSTPRTSFFIGALPHKPGEHFRAILPQMSAPKSEGHVILFQSRFGDPLYTLSTGRAEEVRFSGHSGVFRGLALFLMLIRMLDHDWIGQNRLQNLGLAKVVCTER
ncbi:Cytochrome B561 N-terminal domain-containing protein [Chloropicon primus]|uniref:Cytochrome B561 N-terminal domain-containing protein n=1 Tax=Chloropicon primus TaxID=1764295 RepID=A0A5B8MFL7_9CHLO|nr:Cytochrome B561 N-terminal domain-containing protein [Chloropicon primus]UPQ98310.1 Cytochrome B561 N-terminal domain-containing protein [Chloropicon primus]|eukprot:QDZ19101.1 Cytochrome B561 N-terminal domain-containing protein [Chloropicon primus]